MNNADAEHHPSSLKQQSQWQLVISEVYLRLSYNKTEPSIWPGKAKREVHALQITALKFQNMSDCGIHT
jgi:hypothetical protein